MYFLAGWVILPIEIITRELNFFRFLIYQKIIFLPHEMVIFIFFFHVKTYLAI